MMVLIYHIRYPRKERIHFKKFSTLIPLVIFNDTGLAVSLFTKGARIILTDNDMRSGHPDA